MSDEQFAFVQVFDLNSNLYSLECSWGRYSSVSQDLCFSDVEVWLVFLRLIFRRLVLLKAGFGVPTLCF